MFATKSLPLGQNDLPPPVIVYSPAPCPKGVNRPVGVWDVAALLRLVGSTPCGLTLELAVRDGVDLSVVAVAVVCVRVVEAVEAAAGAVTLSGPARLFGRV